MLAEKYGWTHEEIMRLSSTEALYYLLAPEAFTRVSEKNKQKTERKSSRWLSRLKGIRR